MAHEAIWVEARFGNTARRNGFSTDLATILTSAGGIAVNEFVNETADDGMAVHRREVRALTTFLLSKSELIARVSSRFAVRIAVGGSVVSAHTCPHGTAEGWDCTSDSRAEYLEFRLP